MLNAREGRKVPSHRSISLFTFALLLLAALLIPVTDTHAADLICNSATTISTPTTHDNVTVQSGCVLSVDALLTVTVNMTIEPGGVVTHSPRLEAGLELDVTGTLDVQSGGLIDLNEKGLRGGLGGSAFGTAGEAYDPGCTAIIAGAGDTLNVAAGASHACVGPGELEPSGVLQTGDEGGR